MILVKLKATTHFENRKKREKIDQFDTYENAYGLWQHSARVFLGAVSLTHAPTCSRHACFLHPYR